MDWFGQSLCFCVFAATVDELRVRNMYKQLNNEDKVSADGSETELSELSSAPTSGNYGSTPVQDKTVHPFYVPFCGLVFYIMAFFGFVCSLTLRESLSVAIVAMVNHTSATEIEITIINASNRDQCPRNPVLEDESGEFNWSRSQEGILLAAFYYGYVITQVCSM